MIPSRRPVLGNAEEAQDAALLMAHPG
jgi:hypothetical protein